MYNVQILSTSPDVDCFDCGDNDLNEFLCEDALPHQKQLLAVTHLINSSDNDDIIGYCSLLNDKISLEDTPSKSQWRKFMRLRMPPEKRRYKSLPATKIGRLAVNTPYQRNRHGQAILDHVKIKLIENDLSACRFLTVDAYNSTRVIAFYQDNGFRFLTTEDKGEDTRLMFYDLYDILGEEPEEV